MVLRQTMTFDYIDTLLMTNVVIYRTKICLLLMLTRCQNLQESIDTSNAVHRMITVRCNKNKGWKFLSSLLAEHCTFGLLTACFLIDKPALSLN